MADSLPIFIHIHKCGGSSLSALLRRNLRQPLPQLCASGEIDELKPPGLVASILRTARRDGFVMGHLGYGTHRIFSSPCRYFTMLREPRQRIISLWRHAVSSPDAYYHDVAKGLDFPSFLGMRRPLELDNGLVRFLSGDPSGSNIFINPKPFGALEQSDLDRAVDHLLASCSGFGLVEKFDESLLLLKPLLGLRTCLYGRLNETSSDVQKPVFPDDAMHLVELDQVLYRKAVTVFEQRMAELQPSFNASVERFQALNSFVQPFFRARRSLRQFLR